jgi:MFS family permease
MGGIGGALLNCPAYGAIAHFFNKRRGLATGIAFTAGGIGGIIFPLLLQFLLADQGVGFGWSCRIMGFIMLILCGFANLCIRSRLSSADKGEDIKLSSVLPDITILRNKGFAMAALGIFFMEWGLFVPLTYIVSYAKSHGNGDAASSVLLSLLNAGSVLGRFLPGLVADKLGRFNVIIVTIGLCVTTILAMWLPSGHSKATLMAFCILFGFASGSNLGLTPVCIGQFCDSRDYGRYVTTANMIASFGTLSSVPIGGALLGLGKQTTGWMALIIFSGVSYVVAMICYIYARVSVTGLKLQAKF